MTGEETGEPKREPTDKEGKVVKGVYMNPDAARTLLNPLEADTEASIVPETRSFQIDITDLPGKAEAHVTMAAYDVKTATGTHRVEINATGSSTSDAESLKQTKIAIELEFGTQFVDLLPQILKRVPHVQHYGVQRWMTDDLEAEAAAESAESTPRQPVDRRIAEVMRKINIDPELQRSLQERMLTASDIQGLVQADRAVAIRGGNLITILDQMTKKRIPVRGSQESFIGSQDGEEGLFFMHMLTEAPFYQGHPELTEKLNEPPLQNELPAPLTTEAQVAQTVDNYAVNIALQTEMEVGLQPFLKPEWRTTVTAFESNLNNIVGGGDDMLPVADALEAYLGQIREERLRMKEQNHTLIDLFSGKVDKSNYPRTFWLNRLVNERNQTVNVARRLQEIADTETTTAALVLFSPDVIATAEQVIAYNELDEFAKDPLEVVVRPKKQPGEPHGFVDPNHIVGIIPLGEAARQQARQLKLTP